MCRVTKAGNPQHKTSLLLTSSSFHCTDEKGEKGPLPPSKASTTLTVSFLVGVLIVLEQCLRIFFDQYAKDVHPVLEPERHRHILARHVAVDFLSCGAVAYVGFINRHNLKSLMTLKRDDKFDERIYGYSPAGHHCLLLFFSYQVKNMYDTIKWGDGIIFVLHHILAGGTAWLGMYPGVSSLYAIFFMGISEISTAVLCLLANFDDDFGVAGLDEAFPITKVLIAVFFVVLFIVCRVLLWPLFTYHFIHDTNIILKRDGVRETTTVKNTLRVMRFSLSGLTVLQVLWLGEIIVTAKKEIEALL